MDLLKEIENFTLEIDQTLPVKIYHNESPQFYTQLIKFKCFTLKLNGNKYNYQYFTRLRSA